MRTIDLNGEWMGILPECAPIPMLVPGCFDTYTERKDIAVPVTLFRSITVKKCAGHYYALRFGAVSYYCVVFVNDVCIGCHEGMWDSFLLDATKALHSGENIVRLEITKPGYHDTDPFPLRQVLSGFIPDVLCTFGGIWDTVQLLESSNIFAEYHFAKGSAEGEFTMSCGLYNAPAAPAPIRVCLRVDDADGQTVYSDTAVFPAGSEVLTLCGRIENPQLWSPLSPKLYHYCANICCGEEQFTVSKQFGMRTVSHDGSKLLINGQPVYLRGALHWGYYDAAIIPNPPAETIATELEQLQAYGMNAVKHCLYIPREEYLSQADSVGMLQWVELPLWLPDPTEHLSERIRREYPRIIKQISGHPSIIFTTLGCELDNKVEDTLLRDMYTLLKKETDTLVNDNSGSGECYGGLSDGYADYFDYHFYAELNNMEQLIENFTPAWRNTMPWVFGEFCDSDVLRDLSRVRTEYGVERLMWEQKDNSKNPISLLKPDFYADTHDEKIVTSGIRENFDQKHLWSLNHSMVHRKVTLEMTRACSHICGYNITSIHDVPLCSQGLFDDMGRAKFDTAVFRQSNDDAVLVPAWDLTRIWQSADRVQCRERYNFSSGEQYGVHVLLSNYCGKALAPRQLRYRLMRGEAELLSGAVDCVQAVANGAVKKLATVRFPLPETVTPVTYVLWVTAEAEGRTITNQWPVFVYPAWEAPNCKVGIYDTAAVLSGVEKLLDTVEVEDCKPLPQCDAIITGRLTPNIMDFARSGKRVVLLQYGKGSLPSCELPFWREGMVWRGFPSFLDQLAYDSWMDDLRFYSVTADHALDFGTFDAELLRDYTPILRRYDCRRWLAHDYMARIGTGKGRIYATTLRLWGGYGKQPALLNNNCMGKYLLHGMLTEE